MDLILKFSADDTGAPAVEYAILLACIALAIAAAVRSFGSVIANLLVIPWPYCRDPVGAGLRRGLIHHGGIRGSIPAPAGDSSPIQSGKPLIVKVTLT